MVAAATRTRCVGDHSKCSMLSASLAVAFGMAAVGCDSFHVTQQVARIRVSEIGSELPAGGAGIEWEGRYYQGWMNNLPENERNNLWLSRSMNEPASTDEQGTAALPTNIGTVVGGLFHEPFNPQQDRLTGQAYLFRVRRGDSSETLNVLMVPGHESCGHVFRIAVLSIGSAREITQEYTAHDRAKPVPKE